MGPPFVKLSRQNVLNPMNSHRHVRRRKSGDLRDRSRVHIFEIRDYDLAIQWFESLDQPVEALQIQLPIGRVVLVRQLLEFFEADQCCKPAALPNYIRRGGVVRHTVDPRTQRTAPVKSRETPPDLKMDVLQQIPPLLSVGLIRSCQAFQRRAKLVRRGLIEMVLIGFHNFHI